MRQHGNVRRAVLGGLFLLWSFPLFAQTIKIMPLGDSITLGDKSTDNDGYRRNLYRDLTDDGISVDFVGSLTDGAAGSPLPDKNHEGHPGFKADAILANVNTYLGNVSGEQLVLLHIGTNDVGNGETAASTITEIEGIVDAIRLHDPSIEVFVAALVPANDTFDSEITALNALISDLVSVKRTAGYKIFLVDHNQAFRSNTNWATQWMFDEVHPNDAGYAIMASTWHEAIMMHSQYNPSSNFVDDFNRASLGTDWTAHASIQIAGSTELGNTSGVDAWNDGAEGFLAMQNNFTDANRLSFTYGAGLSSGATDYVGIAMLFDSPSTTGNGYFINRFKGNGTASGTNSDLRLWRVVNGIIQSPNLANIPYSQGAALPGDEFSVEIIATGSGHTFKCYLNGALDGTFSSVSLPSVPTTAYSGVMIYGNGLGAAAQLDNFTLQQAPADDTPPAAITDLDVGAIGATTVELLWTAPGDDDNVGTALSYDVRYSTLPITEALFDAATAISGAPSPGSAGNSESMIASVPNAGTLYYFAIKTSDEAGNKSAISNIASATTTALIVTTDDFNRAGPDPGSNWVHDGPMQIVDVGLGSDDELSNTSANAGEWELAVFTARKNVTNVGFTWGANATSNGIENSGPALLLDNATTTANGYMAHWRTSLNQLRVLKLVNGQPDTPVDTRTYDPNIGQVDPQAGDDVEIQMTTDPTGLHFAFYVNGVYYKKLTDTGAPNFDFNDNLYAGVILQSGLSNNIDDFRVAVAPGAPATLIKISGDNPVQSDTVGQKLALPFVVGVADGGGNPLSNKGVTFTVTAGGGALDAPTSPDGNVHIEAEAGTLVSPMVSDSDTNAASDKYIRSGPGTGTATYTITIPTTGTYRVLARVIAPDGNSDSFLFKVDNNTEFYWKLPAVTSWDWDEVNNQDTTPKKDPVTFNLSAGTHTIVVKTREPGAKLDKMILTTDGTFQPDGKEELGYLTDANGQAQAYLTLGPNTGTNTVQASYGLLTPVTFTATGRAVNACCISYVSGNSLSGAGGSALSQPFVVVVKDADQNPIEGHPVTFVVTQGGGSLSNSQPVLTNASGQASTVLTLGREIATQTVEAQATGFAGLPLTGSPVTFTANASGIASKLVPVSGYTGLTGTVASALPNPIVFKVTDASDNIIPSYPVDVTAIRGGGTASAGNRVKNGTFENGETGGDPYLPTNWQFLSSPSAGEVDVVTSDKHSGTSSVRLNVNASSEGIMQPYSLVANTSYTLIFWARVSSGTLLARWYGSSATISLQVSAAGNGNTWKKYQIQGSNTSSNSYPNNLEFAAIGSVNAYVDDVQLLQNTAANGQISTTWTLGDTAMTQQLQFSATANNVALTGSPYTVNATANAGPAAKLKEVDGDDQIGSAGAALANPLRVMVTDAFDNPKSGHTVTWSVTAGNGKLPGNVTSKDIPTVDGISSVIPTLGPTAGTINNFRAAATGLTGSPITFTATAAVPNSFDITGGNGQIASASLPVTAVPGGQPLTVRITAEGGAPIAGYPVLFEVIQGNGKINNLSTTTIQTDANGEAKAPLVLGPTPGALNKVRASATYNSANIAGSPQTFEVRAAKLTTLAISSGNGQSGAVGQALPAQIKAVVKDSLNNGIKGQSVTFTITEGGGKINGATTPPPIQTDSLGIAPATWTMGTAPVQNSVKAEASALPGSQVTFNATAVPGPPDRLVKVAGDSQSVVINNQLPLPLKVKVTDTYGNGVSGFSVKFKVKAGGGKVNGADSTSQTTGSDGTAQATMTVGSASGSLNNICEVTAKNGPVHLTNSPYTFRETATSSKARFMDYLSGNTQTDTVGKPLANYFVVKITDDTHSNKVIGHPVTFKVIQGGGHLDGGVDTVKTVTTDANGEARVKLTLGPLAGATNIVRATSNDGINPLTVSPIDFSAVSVADGPSATVSTVQATSPVAANGTDTSKVTITVRDNFGNPLPNVAVTIVVGGSSNFIHQPSELTDSNGVVVGGFASTRAEVKSVQAKVIGGVQITNGAQVVFNHLAPYKITGVGGNGQTGNVGTALLNPVAAKVTDVFDNPIAGHPVTFSVQSGGGFFAGTQPLYTGANGIANGKWVLGDNPGSNLAAAASSGLQGTPVSFTATGVVSAAAKLDEESGNDQNGVAGVELADSIVVKVLDSSDRPVANHPVRFKIIFGGGKVNNADSTVVNSDHLGLARAAWKMGTTFGSNFCNAISSGLTGSPVTFRAQAASGTPKTMEKASEPNSGTVGTTVGPIAVLVKDENGNGVSNVQVTFSLTQGTGTLSASSVSTNGSGEASVNLTFGTDFGQRTVVASRPGLQPSTLTFTLTANSSTAKSMVLYRGNNQGGTVSKPLNFPPAVIIKDQYGNPVSGVSVSFVIASGGGNFGGQNPRSVLSNEFGIAETPWTIGAQPGTNQAQAIVQGLTGSPAVFTATGFTNNFPIFTDVLNSDIRENDRVEFTLGATDADGDAISYGAKNLPPGAVFDSLATRLFSWTTNYNSAGVYNVSFFARDGKGGVDEEVVTITVGNLNRAPQLLSHNPVRSDTTLAGGIDLLMTVNATDADGDALTYEWWDNGNLASTTTSYLLVGAINARVPHAVVLKVSDGTEVTPFTWNIVSKIELMSFSAALSDRGGVVLSWKTASETNNYGFNILRSRSQSGEYEKINSSLIRHRNDGEYSFTDRTAEAGARYYYMLQDLDVDGGITNHGPVFIEAAAPETYVLHQNYPNPFNPSTNLSFQLPKGGDVTLTIYNLLGQPVRKLVHEQRAAGVHTVVWDGRNENGEQVPSGVYHYRLQAGSFVETKKMLLMK